METTASMGEDNQSMRSPQAHPKAVGGERRDPRSKV